jgi:MFS family permease
VTGSATAVALTAFFAFVPNVVMMPFAGVLVDRWNRKWTIALTDLTAGIATTGMLVLYLSEMMAIWHVYILVAFAGMFQAFQFPAFSAATTLMVKKKHYARASSMVMLAQAVSMIIAPILAAILLGISDLWAIFAIDIVTFLVALACLAIVPIPELEKKDEEKATVKTVVKGTKFGFQFIFGNRGLLGLQLILFAFNVIATFGIVLLNPMILAKTDNNELLLGSVLSVGAIGGVIGGVIISIWGGPKVRVHGVFIGLSIAATGGIVLGLGRNEFHWMAGMFLFMSTIALTNSSNQAIWQSKVPPEAQGRVFATRAFIATMGIPLSQLIAGPLTDYWAEPLMENATGWLEWLFGSGPGAGMAMIIFFVGVGGVIIGFAGYLFPNVRYVEERMPDHEKAVADDAEEQGTDDRMEPAPMEELEELVGKDPDG